MTKHRRALPQLGGDFFLTDGGLETTLIDEEGIQLPAFAVFPLLTKPAGLASLRRYYEGYSRLAADFGVGLVLESATWRANPDWASLLGYTRQELAWVNRRAVSLLEEIRSEGSRARATVISGCIGPRGDGYVPGGTMSEGDAEAYHLEQVEIFAGTAADMICGMTLNYVAEAVGIARAAERVSMPVAISFTVETDGRLPGGCTLRSAIEQVDAATAAYPSYYMINCAHPTHFEDAIATSEPWVRRVRGVRANASRKSHAELNDSPVVDCGDPVELAVEYACLRVRVPHLNVMGGCCGTDHRHIEQIARACAPLFLSPAAYAGSETSAFDIFNQGCVR